MEQLREHLGVDKWLLRGGSWGVTLSLAYAQRYPERVSGMLMLSVTSTSRLETDRLPTDATPPVSGLLQAYSRMMEDPALPADHEPARGAVIRGAPAGRRR